MLYWELRGSFCSQKPVAKLLQEKAVIKEIYRAMNQSGAMGSSRSRFERPNW